MGKQCKKAQVACCKWSDLSHIVREINSELACIIDEIDPGKNWRIYRVTYPYGAEIVRQDALQLPDAQGLLQVVSPEYFSTQVCQDLLNHAHGMPAGLVMQKSIECFWKFPQRTIPLSGLMTKGALFGIGQKLYPAYHAPTLHCGLTSGARSLFMSPKISEELSHQRLRRSLGITANKPRHLSDHWQLFRQIYHACSEESWQCELLLFSNAWFEQWHDPAWAPLHHYFLAEAWRNSEQQRAQPLWDMIYAALQQEKSLKPRPEIVETTKHLLNIAVGSTPGFVPACDDSAAPIQLLQTIYSNIYQLRRYAPVILQPCLYQPGKQQPPVYYSLNYPTAVHFLARNNEKNSSIAELLQIQSLLRHYLTEFSNPHKKLAHTRHYNISQQTEFGFFHSNAQEYAYIHNNKLLAVEDGYLSHTATNEAVEFPYKGPFVNACIRVCDKGLAGDRDHFTKDCPL